MKKWNGGTTGPNGLYFNLKMWEFVQLDHDKTSILPGGSDDQYYKVPAGLTLIAGPLSGLAFVLFLPFIGIVAMVGYTAYRIARGTRSLTRKQPANNS